MARSHRRIPLLWYNFFYKYGGRKYRGNKKSLASVLLALAWCKCLQVHRRIEKKRDSRARMQFVYVSNPKVSPWSAAHLINIRNRGIAETIVSGAITDWFYEDQDILLAHERRLGKAPLRRRTPARVGLRRDICRASVLVRAAATEPAEILRTLQPWS